MHTCRICGWSGEGKRIQVREMMWNTREVFPYFECGQCHCLQIEKVPEDLGSYYGKDYYSYEDLEGKYAKKVEATDTTRLLDVGCGSGAFLCEMANMGFVNLTGCDPFIEKDIEYSNGVKIYKRTIHEMEGTYDWIYLNDSFEHVTDPNEVIASAKRLLAPDGILRIKLPVYPNIAFDMFGEHWFQIDAPRHICIPSKESMEYLAKQHDMVVLKREYDSNATQIIRSFFYSKDIPFHAQTKELVNEYFSEADKQSIIESSQEANRAEYGDHAVFYLAHKRD